jgi:riboflavin biosynthesis pyrimidine reductase
LLNVARARADAIITTGEVLREEETVTHALQGPGTVPQALADWRKNRLGKHEPPLSVVLTARQIDLDHPLFGCGTIPMIFTSREGTCELEPPAASKGIEIVEHDEPSLREVIRYLQELRGAETIVIEAGPSTSKSLYESPAAVNELMLSVYSGRSLPRSVQGKAFYSLQDLGLVFPMACSTFVSENEESGRWVYRRYIR